MALFLGIDLGSSSVKCVAIDHLGAVQAQAERSYHFDSPREGWLELDPDKWWELTRSALAETVARVDPTQIQGISLCAVMMMAVMLDSSGRPVRPTISWLDQRVLPQLQRIKESGIEQTIFEATGTAVSPSQTIMPLLWVKDNEPDAFGRIAKVVLPKDYIRFKLTGNINTDLTDASGTLLLNNRDGKWSDRIAELLELPREILPHLVTSTEVTGHLLEVVAQEVGLPPGLQIPVVAGAGDGVSTALGLGIVRPGQLGVTVGTAGVLMSASPAFLADKERRCLVFKHPDPALWFLATATNTSGEAVRWFASGVYGGVDPSQQYASFIRDAGQSPPGSRGLMFLPYLAGSRSPHYDPQARGAFLGLDLTCGLPELARSVMEGVAYEIRECFDVHRDVLSLQSTAVEEVRISGGIVRNELWLQILADVLDIPLKVPQADELGAVGAAMNAAIGVGFYADHEEAARRMLVIVREVQPTPHNRGIYLEGYEKFKSNYHRSRIEVPR